MPVLNDVIPLHATPAIGTTYEVPGNPHGSEAFGKMKDGLNATLADPTRLQVSDTLTVGTVNYQISELFAANVYYEQQNGNVTYSNISSYVLRLTNPANPSDSRWFVIPTDSRLAVSFPDAPIPSVQTQGVINLLRIQTMSPITSIELSQIGRDENIDTFCFLRGTAILTPDGEVAIETLLRGSEVVTRDHGPKAISWIGQKHIDLRQPGTEALRPIRILSGALGAALPVRDLLVSPQHRILIRSKIALRMFGTDEVLVAAKQLLGLPGIEIATDLEEVDYIHILFDRHEIIYAEGAEAESLFTGPEALKSVGASARQEIFALFPELAEMPQDVKAARPVIPGRQARRLAARHRSNLQALVQ